MPIEQLKKEFEELPASFFENPEGDDKLWNWIKNRVIPEVTKSMLVKEIDYNRKTVAVVFRQYLDGFNQCCVLQQKKGQEIINKLKI